MCGGGGDDGSEAIRADERKREKKMAESSRSINELFGIYNPENFNPDGTLKQPGATLSYAEWAGQNYPNTPAYSTTETDNSDIDDPVWYKPKPTITHHPIFESEYNAYTKPPEIPGPYGKTEYLGADPDAALRAYENAQAREAAYGDTRGNIMNFFTKGLDEQMGEATEEQTYDLARRGLLKGSEDFQAESDRTKRYDDSLLGLTNQADSQINSLRSSDETARLGLLGAIRAGLDRNSAIAGATNQLKTNLEGAATAGKNTQFSNLFGDLEDIYKLNTYRKGQQQGAVSQRGGGGFSLGGSPSPYNPSPY